MEKLWLHAGEHHAAVSRKESVSYATKRMELEHLVRHETSQSPEVQYRTVPPS